VVATSSHHRKCRQIDDRAIRHLAKHCTNLVTLDLSACVSLTDAAMRFVRYSPATCSRGHDNTRHVELTSQCYSLTFHSEDCHALEELDVSFCARLTPQSLDYLAAVR
jgi:hypothetical protein